MCLLAKMQCSLAFLLCFLEHKKKQKQTNKTNSNAIHCNVPTGTLKHIDFGVRNKYVQCSFTVSTFLFSSFIAFVSILYATIRFIGRFSLIYVVFPLFWYYNTLDLCTAYTFQQDWLLCIYVFVDWNKVNLA